METVLRQINKAYKLIEDLEALNLVRVLKKNVQSKEKLSKNLLARYIFRMRSTIPGVFNSK